MLHPAPNNTGNYMKKEELRNFFLLHFQRWRHKHIYLFPALYFLIKSLCAKVFRLENPEKIFSSFSKNKQANQKNPVFFDISLQCLKMYF